MPITPGDLTPVTRPYGLLTRSSDCEDVGAVPKPVRPYPEV